jgi:hypothetical protein
MTTVNFKDTNGQIESRSFPKGDSISVYGQATDSLGIWESFAHVRIELFDSSNTSIFFDETTCSALGNWDTFIPLPNIDTTGIIRVTITNTVIGQDIINVPIAIGNAIPAEMTAPIASAQSLADNIKTIIEVAIVLLIVVVILYALKTGREAGVI